MDQIGGILRRVSARVGAPLLLAYAIGPISFLFLWGLRSVGLVADLPLWVYAAAWLGPTMASTATNLVYARRPSRTAVQARALTDAIATTVMIYATGWGPALGVTYIVAAQQLVAARGPKTWRVCRVWAFVGIGAGQLAIALGWAPSFLALHLANGVAAVGGLAFIFVSRMAETISADRDRAWEHVRLSEARLSSLVQSSSDLIAVLDQTGAAIYVSGATERILGLTSDQFMAEELASLVHPDDVEPVRRYLSEALTRPGPTNPVALRVRHRNGQWRHLEAVGTNLNDDPSVGGVVLNIRDVTERKQVESELAHQSAHDALTGLPNRVLFLRQLEESLARTSHSGSSPTVLFLDVDRFKLVNDSLGHDAGDQLLIEAAQRLRAAVRSADLVARFGGDEFVILCEGPTDAQRVAQRVLEAFQAPFRLDGSDYQLSASVGVAFGQGPGNSAGDIIRDADTAMYRAKELGRGRIAVFDEDARALALHRVHIEHELRSAIERDELRLLYQPIVDLASGRVVAAEPSCVGSIPRGAYWLPVSSWLQPRTVD
jgi:diguanylate cyclase (GGDEF)-like protein/PAS domain S-box-containing protein